MPYAGYYTEQQKISGVFSVLVQTNSFVTTLRKMAKEMEILWLVFYPSLSDSPVKKYATWQNFIVFLLESNSIHNTCLLESPQKFCFDVLQD